MKLEDLIEKFSAAVGIENVPAVEGVWKFSADGNVFGVTGDETGETVWLFGEVPWHGRRDLFAQSRNWGAHAHRIDEARRARRGGFLRVRGEVR